MQPGFLTLITQNIYGVPFAKDARARAESFVRFANENENADAEFVLVQEAFFSNTRDRLKNSPKHPYFSLPEKTRPYKAINSGLAALSRYPILEKKIKPLTGLKNTDALADKGILLTRVAHPVFGEVDVYTLHLQAAYADADQYTDVRDHQIREVLAFIKENSADRTIVLAGDFNMLESHSTYGRIMGDRDLEFIDVMRELHPDHPLYTWRVDNPYTNNYYPDMRLDYVFLRPGTGWRWDAKGSRSDVLIPEESPKMAGDAYFSDKTVSDHFGVFAELRLVPMMS